jgi:hypothetical protein
LTIIATPGENGGPMWSAALKPIFLIVLDSYLSGNFSTPPYEA